MRDYSYVEREVSLGFYKLDFFPQRALTCLTRHRTLWGTGAEGGSLPLNAWGRVVVVEAPVGRFGQTMLSRA